MSTEVFTAQDARNIVEIESKVTLGKIIDAIRAGAKQGYDQMSITGANIDQEIIDTLIERGFEIKDDMIIWAITPEEATAPLGERSDEDTTMAVVIDDVESEETVEDTEEHLESEVEEILE